MKRILFLLFAIGLTVGTTAMAGMSTSKVRKETRFLTDKMAYELSLSTQQYNDAYEINYDFIYSVCRPHPQTFGVGRPGNDCNGHYRTHELFN